MKAIGFAIGVIALGALAQPQPVQYPSLARKENPLDVYAQLTGRTVLVGTPSPLPPSLLSELPAQTKQAIAYIESELAKKQFEAVPDGDLFVRILPEGWRDSTLATQLASIRAPQSETKKDISAGTIYFINIDLGQVLAIYAELCNRTILRSGNLPAPPLCFRTQTTMSKDEALYGLNVLFAMNGIAALDDGDKFVQIVPLSQAPKAELHAPQPEAGAPLIAPDSVPELRHELPFRRMPLPGPPEASGIPPDPPAQPTTTDLFAYYAKLIGREAAPLSSSYSTLPLVFKARTPLTKAELIYAIETTFALNNLAAIPIGDNSVRLGSSSERHKSE